MGGSVHTIKENAETLVVGSKYIGLGENGDNLSTWSCHEIGMQGKLTVRKLVIIPLNWLKRSDIWEQL